MVASFLTTAWALAILAAPLGASLDGAQNTEGNAGLTEYSTATRTPIPNQWGFISPLGTHYLQSRAVMIPLRVIKPQYVNHLLEKIEEALQELSPIHSREPRW